MSRAKLILSSALGTSSAFGKRRNVPDADGFNQARVDNTESYYIVYREPDFCDATFATDDGDNFNLVTLTSNLDIGFNVRSFQGFDKTGITVFEHQYYSGTGVTYTKSNPDISSAFPTREEGGASSFIVSRGVWSFYTETNYNGILLRYNDKTEFGPGDYLLIVRNSLGDNRIKSIRYIREN